MYTIVTPDKIRKYEYLKTWVKHEALGVNLSISTLFAAGLTYLWLAPHDLADSTVGALRAGILAGALASNILYHKTKNSRPDDYTLGFVSKTQARTVTRQAATILNNVASLHAQKVLNAALHQISYAHTLCLRTEQSHPTAAGNLLSVQGQLPQNDAEALSIILHEACFDLVKHNAIIKDRAQRFITANFPDLIMVKPAMFPTEQLDNQRPGLGSVVESLIAMDYSTDEIRVHIKNWAESQDRARDAKSAPELPKDLSI